MASTKARLLKHDFPVHGEFQYEPQSRNRQIINLRKKRGFRRFQKERLKVRGLQTRPNSHLPAREAPKDQNRHVQIRAPKPSSVSTEQEQTYTNSHPLVEDTPAEDLLAAGGANSGRFGARWKRLAGCQADRAFVPCLDSPINSKGTASATSHRYIPRVESTHALLSLNATSKDKDASPEKP